MNIRGSSRNWISRWWSLLRGAPLPVARDGEDNRPCLPCNPAAGDAADDSRAGLPADLGQVGPDRAAVSHVVLQFPLRGEALLVRLAELLRKRFADQGAGLGRERDPLQLSISRCPGSRLSIDLCAYLEFDADRSAYLMVIEAAPDTTITLDTTNFDTAVEFVGQYVAERLSKPAALEVAS